MAISLKHQQGLTLISIIFILGLIGFFTLLTLKIVPIYLDHGKVTSALTALKQLPDIQTKSEAEIRESLVKRFNINYVYDVTKDDIKIIKHGTYLKVDIEYETVVKLAGNLSALAEFHDSFEVGQE
jgi:Tfp pilus assembly major pilin PilA